MHKSIFNLFIRRIIDLTSVDDDFESQELTSKTSDVNAAIVKSIRSFQSYATTIERGESKSRLSFNEQFASNVIMKAASYETALNKTWHSSSIIFSN